MKPWLILSVVACVVGCGSQDMDALRAAASSGSSEPAPSVVGGKPVPEAPPVQPGVTLGSELQPKPESSPELRSAAAAWSVSVTASATELWPTQYTTLTATASADVGPTPYYIRILDYQSGAFLGSCGSGTTCAVPVTRPTSGYAYFAGIIADSLGNEVARSWISVNWHLAYLSMSVSAATLPVGSTTTLSVSSYYDVGPSPFYIELFDTTTGTFLKRCGSGTLCTVDVSQTTAGTHTYRAFLSQYGDAYPPPGIQESTATHYVTWTSSAWSVSLSTDTSGTYSYVTLTATASADVSEYPYAIQIFDDKGRQVAYCAYASVCSVQYWPTLQGNDLVAFIALPSKVLPPPDIQASSKVVHVALLPPPG
ncbi:hypothetical protein JY651_20425 [Pyxidicoccus parkwayensis]|uniref:Uncharacterized protein n=1 Tax=Pyxidicoccus parkwayensis TaxID=2813578 RepID=A0ABX7P9J5_9BACT|nr:hypothetical protein [Pyxidicoccus parkwaysis]QSQ27131.1 hypothetical protein JY651_20425 [Pyxidicoccus parkwaysis]